MKTKAFRVFAVGVLTATSLSWFGPSAATAENDAAGADRPQPVDRPLRDLARRHDLRIGTAVDMSALANDAPYRARVASEFSAVTAENVMKWETIEPQRGVYNFGPADELIDFARRNGQKVHGHTLLWHNQNPRWLTDGLANGSITPTELREILRRHIIDTVRHFRGRVWHWDVVNEVIDDSANLRDTIWLRNLGPGYIADAFRWAHQADPRVKLYVNDYNVEGLNPKSDAYYALVKQLLADRVPVHGFGAQGHLGVQFGTPGGIAQNLRRFEDLGLETAITEADVRMPLPPDATKLSAQAYGFTVLLQGCLLARRCVMFTLWGFTDRYSWVPGVFNGQGAATPFDENLQPKEAYRALQTTLALSTGPRHRD